MDDGMSLTEYLQNRFGGQWVGVNFYHDVPPACEIAEMPTGRFCEALASAHTRPLLITRDNLYCPGASYVFGWQYQTGAEMAQKLHHDHGFSVTVARTLLRHVPRIKGHLWGIVLNGGTTPDVLISYLEPAQIMTLIRAAQIILRTNLSVDLSSIVSVCGHVAAQSFLAQRVAMSFGCVYSRRYGGITSDKVAVGIPFSVAASMVG